MVIRVPAHEHVLYKRLRADDLDVHSLRGERESDAVNFLRLPALLDAIIDKCYETS